MSDLHRENLDAWNRRNQSAAADPVTSGLQYRDRAKERRLKYGGDDEDEGGGGGGGRNGGGRGKRNSLKESYLAAVKEAEAAGLPERAIDSSNVGNRMMQKMGWKEGLGLGKDNKGRTDIIKVLTKTIIQ